jgi:hypothetical protein
MPSPDFDDDDENLAPALPPESGERLARLAELAADLDRARARVAASLTTLGEEVSRRGDWRAWVRARPGLVLAGALALGFVWGGGGPPPQT